MKTSELVQRTLTPTSNSGVDESAQDRIRAPTRQRTLLKFTKLNTSTPRITVRSVGNELPSNEVTSRMPSVQMWPTSKLGARTPAPDELNTSTPTRVGPISNLDIPCRHNGSGLRAEKRSRPYRIESPNSFSNDAVGAVKMEELRKKSERVSGEETEDEGVEVSTQRAKATWKTKENMALKQKQLDSRQQELDEEDIAAARILMGMKESHAGLAEELEKKGRGKRMADNSIIGSTMSSKNQRARAGVEKDGSSSSGKKANGEVRLKPLPALARTRKS